MEEVTWQIVEGHLPPTASKKRVLSTDKDIIATNNHVSLEKDASQVDCQVKI